MCTNIPASPCRYKTFTYRQTSYHTPLYRTHVLFMSKKLKIRDFRVSLFVNKCIFVSKQSLIRVLTTHTVCLHKYKWADAGRGFSNNVKIMEQNNLKKIFSLFFFLVFAAASCWATTESLRLLLPSWPTAIVWSVTIGFFIIASIGTKMIVDSLNQNIYLEGRGIRLMGGVVLIVIFWLICSMPTNTHTFFYRMSVGDVVSQDLATTKNYLHQLHDNIKNEEEIKQLTNQLESNINAQLIALENEIDNIANPGFGDRAKSHLDKIATTLQVKAIPVLSFKGTSPQQIKALKQQYRTLVYELMNKRIEDLRKNNTNPEMQLYKAEAEQGLRDIEHIQEQVAKMNLESRVDNETILKADGALKKGYATIKNYHKHIRFQSAKDRDLYLAPNPVTKTSRMLSVIDVWKDYFAGLYEGRGFIFWIILSIIIDVAAFIFFDYAFKRRDD